MPRLTVGSHTELQSTPSRRPDTLTQIVSPLPHEMDSYLNRNCTLWEINWDRLRLEV